MGDFFGSNGTKFLINELQNEIGLEMILYALDGTVYFGLLQRIEDCHIARLTPASGQRSVIVIPPNGKAYREDFTFLDLCTLVAKSINQSTSPFEDFDCE